MAKFYKASNDKMFKAIFCDAKNKDLLERLIEEAIGRKVKIKKQLMQELIKPNIYVKNKTVDILTEAEGEIINIELNVGTYDGLNNRNAAYIFSKYSEDIKVSKNYKNMNNFIQINLTTGLPKEKELFYKYKLRDEKTNEEFIDNLAIYVFNLDKLKKVCYNEDNKYKLISALDCDKNELQEVSKKDEFLKKLESEVVRMNNDEKFTCFLTEEEDAEKVHNTLMFNAKEEGIKEGSKQEKITIAKNMIKENIDIYMICKITGLTKKEIENLK